MLSFVITTIGELVIAIIREEVMRALLLGFLLLAAGPALAAEKYVGSNVDARTILAFKVADAAVQKLLPQGWGTDGPPAARPRTSISTLPSSIGS